MLSREFDVTGHTFDQLHTESFSASGIRSEVELRSSETYEGDGQARFVVRSIRLCAMVSSYQTTSTEHNYLSTTC